MVLQPRRGGTFQSPYKERRGDAIALRLPLSLDAEVRRSAGWQSAADNTALRDWVEGACKDCVSGATSPAPTGELPSAPGGYSIAQIRAAANYVAVRVPIKSRTVVVKAFDALIGELLANGD